MRIDISQHWYLKTFNSASDYIQSACIIYLLCLTATPSAKCEMNVLFPLPAAPITAITMSPGLRKTIVSYVDGYSIWVQVICEHTASRITDYPVLLVVCVTLQVAAWR